MTKTVRMEEIERKYAETPYPEISAKFNMDDIRKIRDYMAPILRGMTKDEYKEYFKDVAKCNDDMLGYRRTNQLANA